MAINDVVTVTLRAVTAGFTSALRGAGRELVALQRQAANVSASFRFIGGALAVGGLVKGVAVLGEFEDQLAALKGALSFSIKSSAELDKNVRLLGLGFRELALNSRFSASEIAEAGAQFAKANFNPRQIQVATRAVEKLAAVENISITKATESAIGILKGLNLNLQEFNRVVDVLATVSVQSSVGVLDLAEAFKFAATKSRLFNQDFEETAVILGIFGDNALAGSLGGTSFSRVLEQLIKDVGKARPLLEKLGISVFEGGEFAETATSKFRPLVGILRDLQQKAGIEEFQNLFQSRALSGALVLAKVTEEQFAKLVAQTKELGNAQKLAAFRSDTLVGEFNRLRAAAEELLLAIGFEGGLIESLRGISSTIRGFVLSLASADNQTLKFVTALIVAGIQVAGITAALVAAGGAAAALLSPIGRLASAFFIGFAKGKGIFDEFGPELEKLSMLFFAVAKKIGAKIGLFLADGFFNFFTTVTERLQQSEISNLFGLKDALVSTSRSLASGFFDIAKSLDEVSRAQDPIIEQAFEQSGAFRRLIVDSSELSGTLDAVREAFDNVGGKSLSKATILVEELREKFEKLGKIANESVLPQITLLIANLPPGLEDVRVELEKLFEQARQLEENIDTVERFGSATKNLEEATKLTQDTFDELTKRSLGDFEFETQKIISQLEDFRAVIEKVGSDEQLDQIDQLIERFKMARMELKEGFTVEFGKGIQQGVRELVSGLIRGTRESVSAADILKSALIAEFESLFEQIILRKLKFDKVFEDNFAGLGKFVSSFIQKVAAALRDFFSQSGTPGQSNAASGLVQGIIKGIGSFFSSTPALASGGIAVRPTFAMLAEGGEAEAIIPLSKLADIVGGGGTQVVVNNNGALPADQIAVREAGEGRDRFTEIVLGTVARDINRGGIVQRATQSRNRVRTRVER